MKKTGLILVASILIISCKSSDKKANPELKSSITQGEKVYQNFCINCHMANGEGIEGVYPPLANSDYLENNLEASIKGIKNGMKGKITVNGKTYNNVMTPMGLNNQEVADVTNYILNNWGNNSDTLITSKEVSKILLK
ncbi:c-type cytochrome [Mesoflavibacter zeaxanthinifaciens]|uniref:c-type cytochrome n=1 Tax=Mesoflavibacter zeaxanthinifaciens TaxID=393060 RepID=UPI003A93C7D8